MKKRKQAALSYVLIWIALIGIGAAAYSNTFQVPFVFDDYLTIQRNVGVRFTEFNWNMLSGRSVLYLTFTGNYAWTGQEVWSYHLVNLILHIANGLMVFWLALCIFRQTGLVERFARASGFFAAGFFLVHPVQTESVTYISSRSELLAGFFYLIGMLLFMKWPYRRGFLLFLIMAIVFFLGLGSKETVITLPLAIMLYDYLFLSEARLSGLLSRWRFYAPFVVGGLGAIYYIVTVTLRQSIGGSLPGHLTPWQYLLTQTQVVCQYIYLVFWPVSLNLDYDWPASKTLLDPYVIGAILLHAGILFLAYRLCRAWPVFAFSIVWFYLTLAPTSSVVPILDVIFEHRLYLSMIGVCISFPLLIDLVSRKLQEGWSRCANVIRASL